MLKLNLTLTKTQERITTRALAASLVFAVLTAVCAQVGFHVPWTPVPITLQVFAVLLSGLILGPKLGALTQIEYLAVGLAGAPVFSGFMGGPAAMLRPSGGYIIGFVLGAYVAGLVGQRFGRSTASALFAGAVGTITIYCAGVIWLAVYLNAFKGQSMAWQAWIYGALPFIGVDAVKSAAAAIVVTSSAPLIERLRGWMK